jgi:7-cyano-7-deazaguanine synthase
MSASSPSAVLVSGGLDSAILVGERLQAGETVHPLYVRCGFLWEDVELAHLRRFLDALHSPRLHPLQVLHQPVSDLIPHHWGLSGTDVPDGDSPDDAVYLPGRNVLLLSKALLWCHLNAVAHLHLGILHGNPFADASPSFLDSFSESVNTALDSLITIHRPYARLSKTDILLRGRSFPISLTFSCLRPIEGRHCGDCNKCSERRRGFASAGLTDLTEYAAQSPVA